MDGEYPRKRFVRNHIAPFQGFTVVCGAFTQASRGAQPGLVYRALSGLNWCERLLLHVKLTTHNRIVALTKYRTLKGFNYQ